MAQSKVFKRSSWSLSPVKIQTFDSNHATAFRKHSSLRQLSLPKAIFWNTLEHLLPSFGTLTKKLFTVEILGTTFECEELKPHLENRLKEGCSLGGRLAGRSVPVSGTLGIHHQSCRKESFHSRNCRRLCDPVPPLWFRCLILHLQKKVTKGRSQGKKSRTVGRSISAIGTRSQARRKEGETKKKMGIHLFLSWKGRKEESGIACEIRYESFLQTNNRQWKRKPGNQEMSLASGFIRKKAERLRLLDLRNQASLAAEPCGAVACEVNNLAVVSRLTAAHTAVLARVGVAHLLAWKVHQKVLSKQCAIFCWSCIRTACASAAGTEVVQILKVGKSSGKRE